MVHDAVRQGLAVASSMALTVDPSLALGTLQTLADRQGTVVDPVSEEEPGKILHELRLDVSSGLSLGGQINYYGRSMLSRWTGSSITATKTVTGLSSTSASILTGLSAKAGRTPGMASTSPTAQCIPVPRVAGLRRR